MIPIASIVPVKATRELPSPNQSARSGNVIRVICLHATADRGNEAGAEGWLTNKDSGVSAHLHIRRDGTVTRFVPDAAKAWHAGKSQWRGLADVNQFSLGWELANRNDGQELYTEAQYKTVAQLALHYVRQGMPLDSFTSHAEVARPVGRKNDPFLFDWQRFRATVATLLEPPAPPPVPHIPAPKPDIDFPGEGGRVHLDNARKQIPHAVAAMRLQGMPDEDICKVLRALEPYLLAAIPTGLGGGIASAVLSGTIDRLCR